MPKLEDAPNAKRALICGISGQDGAYLARLLLEKGYEVVGASRDAETTSFHNLRRLGIADRIRFVSTSLVDFRSVFQTLRRVHPGEIYNLAGQSSVGLSFEQPVEALESIVLGTLNLLEGIRFLDEPVRLYNAGSGECYGNIDAPADEATPFQPRSPYAVAKAAAFWEVANYREAYNLYCCTGILFNHESPLRSERFVTRKIVSTACRIAAGSGERLRLGNTAISRDWGWAPEYVVAMWSMLQQPRADDFVIATGRTNRLEEFAAEAFRAVGLDWRAYVDRDPVLLRPSDVERSSGNPAKAARDLSWRPQALMPDVVRMMVEAERQSLAGKENARL